jgi:signal transduction histidine kinase
MVCAVIRDITERRQAEEALRKAHTELEKFNVELEKKVQERTAALNQKNEQLVEAERLAAIGKMANRVAHELRNPLTVIGGFARRINERTPTDDPNKKYLRMIVEEVISMESKVSEITRIQSQ